MSQLGHWHISTEQIMLFHEPTISAKKKVKSKSLLVWKFPKTGSSGLPTREDVVYRRSISNWRNMLLLERSHWKICSWFNEKSWAIYTTGHIYWIVRLLTNYFGCPFISDAIGPIDQLRSFEELDSSHLCRKQPQGRRSMAVPSDKGKWLLSTISFSQLSFLQSGSYLAMLD